MCLSPASAATTSTLPSTRAAMSSAQARPASDDGEPSTPATIVRPSHSPLLGWAWDEHGAAPVVQQFGHGEPGSTGGAPLSRRAAEAGGAHTAKSRRHPATRERDVMTLPRASLQNCDGGVGRPKDSRGYRAFRRSCASAISFRNGTPQRSQRQIRAVASELAVRTSLPSELKAALLTAAPWPRRVARLWPVAVSQIRAVSSQLAVTTNLPSELKAALLTEALWPRSVSRLCPVAVSQIRAVSSSSAVTTSSPSGLKAAPLTMPV